MKQEQLIETYEKIADQKVIMYFKPYRHFMAAKKFYAQLQDGVADSGGIRVIFNPSHNEHNFHFDEAYRVIADENGDSGNELTQDFRVPPCTCLVLSKPLKSL